MKQRMKSPFDALIEHIINDDEGKAAEVFHNIVVKSSRKIYENIMNDEECGIGGNRAQGLVHEISAEEEGFAEGEFSDDEFGTEGDDLGGELGGDDLGGDDLGGDDLGGDDLGGEGDLGSKIDQLGDTLSAQLDDLKAEFERRMAGDTGDDEGADDFGGEEDFGADGDESEGDEEDFGAEEGEPAGDEEEGDEDLEESLIREYARLAGLREYVEDQGEIYKQEPASGEGKIVGKEQSSKPSLNTKSVVAGKNDMGGTTANIVKGGSEASPDGNTPKKPSNYVAKGDKKISNDQFKNAPGNKKVWDSKQGDAHGAEKKGGNEGSEVADGGKVPVNDTTLLKRR
jgi:hypothetical protein